LCACFPMEVLGLPIGGLRVKFAGAALVQGPEIEASSSLAWLYWTSYTVHCLTYAS
jgi:hypothetical protein